MLEFFPTRFSGLSLLRRSALFSGALLLASGALTSEALAQNSKHTVDVMFLYSPAAAQYGGNMETRLNQYIAQSNQAYDTGNIPIQLRLVHSYQSNRSAYATTGNTALNELTYNDSEAHTLRDRYGADFVAVLGRSNGSLCGVAWLGSSNNGVINSYSKDMAYGSSAIDCGYLTFTHELGHNMGLMHSRRQGDTSGGHHVYGMGYGVDNAFATIMAYAHLFSTSYIYQFSNPQQTCRGYVCGDAQTADAARSLRLMASQYPSYRPTRVEPGNPDPGTPTPTADPVLPVPAQGDNLIANPSFEGNLTTWQAAYGAELSLSNQRRRGGNNSALVGNRSSYASGISQSLTGKLQTGREYKVSLWMRLDNSSSDTARVVMQINGGDRYIDLKRAGVTNGWSEITAQFTYDGSASDQISLLVYGPASGVSFYLDSVDVSPVGNPPAPSNLVRNGDFESGSATPWATSYNGTLALSSDAYRSQRSLQLYNRYYWYDGVYQSLPEMEPGKQYRASSMVKLGGGSDTVSLWLYIRDDSGTYWQQIGSRYVYNNTWTEVSTGTFAFKPVGRLYSVSFHVMGPVGGISMKVDDVVLKLANP